MEVTSSVFQERVALYRAIGVFTLPEGSTVDEMLGTTEESRLEASDAEPAQFISSWPTASPGPHRARGTGTMYASCSHTWA